MYDNAKVTYWFYLKTELSYMKGEKTVDINYQFWLTGLLLARVSVQKYVSD